MEQYDLTREQVEFIVCKSENTYTTSGAKVYYAKLPDGRIGKVRVRSGKVMDAFTLR